MTDTETATATARACREASRRLLGQLFILADAIGVSEQVERIRAGLNLPGLVEGRDVPGFVLVALECLEVLTISAIDSQPKAQAAFKKPPVNGHSKHSGRHAKGVRLAKREDWQ